MRNLISVLAGFVLLSFAGTLAANADVKLSNGTMLLDKPYFIVTYIEAAPSDAAKVAALIKTHIAASLKEKGNLRFEGLRRIGRKNHFAILEAWTDKAARDAHAKSAHTIKFRKDLQPYLYNPYDERPSVGLVAADPTKIKKGTRATLYVLTHADLIPPEQFPPCKRQVDENGPCGDALLKKLAADSRKQKGMLRFDILTQANRPNHNTIVEMWTSSKAQQAHTVSTEVKTFRDGLSGIKPGSGVNPDPLFVLNPLTGSLYDERLYRLIR
jgi:quinol monooxygenase YgiN